MFESAVASQATRREPSCAVWSICPPVDDWCVLESAAAVQLTHGHSQSLPVAAHTLSSSGAGSSDSDSDSGLYSVTRLTEVPDDVQRH